LGPLLAAGLIIFATSWPRIISLLKTSLFYAVTLIPLLIFRSRNPHALTQRFYLISYIKPDSPWSEIIPRFVRRYLEDLSLISLLLDGDANPRHHMPGALGSFLIGAFILTAIGLIIVLVRRWQEPWWRFVIFGAAASIVPGALTNDQFHSLRIVAYPIFLLLLTIPALQLSTSSPGDTGNQTNRFTRPVVLATIFAAMAVQGFYFQSVYRRDGADRGF